MKHTLKVTIILVSLFLLAQIIGLLVTGNYLKQERLPYDIERPEIEEKTAPISIFIIILVATGIALFLIKIGAFKIWKAWFFIGVLFTLLIAFGAFVNEIIALILAAVLAIIKIFKPNVIIHNFTELFIYAGLAGIFVPILNLLAISILLLVISIYDMIAVWKTKHMVKLAKFQSKVKLFAGLAVPYGKDKLAVLGGGDIGFPLLFAGVVLKTTNMLNALIVVLFVCLALFGLFIYSKKNRFYPAMPFLTIGCGLGYLVTFLISL
jgi:presenilin-like A22 family membrane protease